MPWPTPTLTVRYDFLNEHRAVLKKTWNWDDQVRWGSFFEDQMSGSVVEKSWEDLHKQKTLIYYCMFKKSPVLLIKKNNEIFLCSLNVHIYIKVRLILRLWKCKWLPLTWYINQLISHVCLRRWRIINALSLFHVVFFLNEHLTFLVSTSLETTSLKWCFMCDSLWRNRFTNLSSVRWLKNSFGRGQPL